VATSEFVGDVPPRVIGKAPASDGGRYTIKRRGRRKAAPTKAGGATKKRNELRLIAGGYAVALGYYFAGVFV
jgi:hypothetical protein